MHHPEVVQHVCAVPIAPAQPDQRDTPRLRAVKLTPLMQVRREDAPAGLLPALWVVNIGDGVTLATLELQHQAVAVDTLVAVATVLQVGQPLQVKPLSGHSESPSC